MGSSPYLVKSKHFESKRGESTHRMEPSKGKSDAASSVQQSLQKLKEIKDIYRGRYKVL